MKRLLFIVIMFAMGFSKIANTQNRFSRGELLQCSNRTLIVKDASDINVIYTDANNPYNEYKPATSSNPEYVYEENYGWQKVDNSRFVKPSRESVIEALREVLGNYDNYMPADIRRSRNQSIVIYLHMDNDGDFVNALISIRGNAETLNSITVEQLNGIYNVAAGMKLGVPTEYQAISDHYFGYCILFQEL